ncbi:MAG TPA: 50S ribosomal protein L23 [Blastocatellia bacterium]|jgi:large subunit ribosomal protein L23|nr:50S ribosomal protein L23 [Blastocatellia bacterium]
MKSIWDVIKGPVITEKALTMKDEVEALGREGNAKQLLTLKVDRRATKPEIKHAVEKIFGVKVEEVRVANYHGKMKRIPTRREMGRRSDWKKAFVTLKSGEKPVMYEDVI